MNHERKRNCCKDLELMGKGEGASILDMEDALSSSDEYIVLIYSILFEKIYGFCCFYFNFMFACFV